MIYPFLNIWIPKSTLSLTSLVLTLCMLSLLWDTMTSKSELQGEREMHCLWSLHFQEPTYFPVSSLVFVFIAYTTPLCSSNFERYLLQWSAGEFEHHIPNIGCWNYLTADAENSVQAISKTDPLCPIMVTRKSQVASTTENI